MAEVGEFSGKRLIGCSVEALIGSGWFGEVYKAVHPALSQPIALKILAPEISAHVDASWRLRKEVSQVAALYHPAIVRVFGIDTHEDRLVISMTLAHESLASHLAREQTPVLDWCVRQVLRIASGLQAAHSVGVIHGDLKPTNVLLDSLSRAVVTDFGQGHRVPGFAGSVSSYQAPEVLAGQPPTPHSDVFSLGMILYQLITGVLPRVSLPGEIASGKFAPPSRFNGTLDQAIDYVVLNALASSPADRYPDVLSFSVDLRAAQEPEAEGLLTTSPLRYSARRGEPVATIPLLLDRNDQTRQAQVLREADVSSMADAAHRMHEGRRIATRASSQDIDRNPPFSKADYAETDTFPHLRPLPPFRLVPVSISRPKTRSQSHHLARPRVFLVALIVLILIALLASATLAIALHWHNNILPSAATFISMVV